MLEDACLLTDRSVLPSLFEVDAVLLARGISQVHGRPAIAKVMQSGPLALIISGAAISVARRNLDGWHYVISRLGL